MGKVLVSGHAEQELAPDYGKITLTVNTEGKTAAKATASTMEEFENLIARLVEQGFKPENMVISNDVSSKPYRRDEDDYTSARTVQFRIPAETAIVNRIHDLIASGFENTTLSVSYDLSNRAEIMRRLTILAIQDSRKTADLLAEAIGTRIAGIDAARLDESDDMNLDIADLDLTIIGNSPIRDTIRCCYGESAVPTPCSDRLKPEKITMEADVNIVWLLE